MIKNYRLSSFLICILLVHSIHGSCQTLVATLSAGPAWYNDAGKTQTIYLQPDFANTYIAQHSNYQLTNGEFFLGVQKTISPLLIGQLGLAVATTSYAHLQGDVWETADPLFDNFSYQYNITHTRVAVKGKLLSQQFSSTWLPYLSGSLGAGFNRAYQFSTKAKLFEAIPTAGFEANKQTSFSYTLGAGLQKALSQHLQVGVGYEFANWGSSSLGREPGQFFNHGLEINHLFTHQLQFNISYLS